MQRTHRRDHTIRGAPPSYSCHRRHALAFRVPIPIPSMRQIEMQRPSSAAFCSSGTIIAPSTIGPVGGIIVRDRGRSCYIFADDFAGRLFSSGKR